MAKRGYFGVNHRTGLTQGSQGLTMEGQAPWRARAKTRKLGKMGKGPVPNRSFSPRNRIFFPANLDHNQDPSFFSEKPKLHFRRLPQISVGNSTFPKLSSELTLNSWGVPRSIRTDLDGYGQP